MWIRSAPACNGRRRRCQPSCAGRAWACRQSRRSAQPGSDGETIMIDSTHLKAHRTAATSQKGDAPAGHRTDQRRAELQAAHGCATGWSASDLLPVAQPDGRLRRARWSCWMPCRPQRCSWATRATMPIGSAKACDKGIAACIPARRGRRTLPATTDAYKQGHRVEQPLRSPKDWRRIATATTVRRALPLRLCIAATVIFWL